MPARLEALLLLLSDDNCDVASLADSLKRFGDEAIDRLIQLLKDRPVRSRAALVLGYLKAERAVSPLCEALLDHDRWFPRTAAAALTEIGPASIDGLAAVVLDGPDGSRDLAAWALGGIQDPRSVPPLCLALIDTYALVREKAAFALGRLRNACAIPALVQTLTGDPEEAVRKNAAEALRRIGSSDAIPGLCRALTDVSEAVRKEAATSLATIGDESAVPSLIGAAADPVESVRKSVMEALCAAGDARAIDAAANALHDSNISVRHYAANLLARCGSAAIPVLTVKLRSDDEDVRVRAAFALGRIRDSSTS